MKKNLLLFICLLAVARADNSYLLVDPHFSPYAGGEDLITASRFAQWVDCKLKPPCECPPRGFLAGTKRFFELAFVWDPINHFLMVSQHEIFGHGYRIREIGNRYCHVQGYGIDPPPPYGPGGGVTAYKTTSKFTASQEIAIAAAGVEGTSILANRLKMHWIADQRIRSVEATLYLSSAQDLTEYAFSLDKDSVDSDAFDGNDMSAYLFWLNRTYSSGHLTSSGLKQRSLINLADPMTFYSIFAWLRYIVTGCDTPIPMLHIGNWDYLPNLRLALAPYGPEYYFESFFRKECHPAYLYLRAGNYGHNDSCGIGYEDHKLTSWSCIDIGLRCDLWWQPPIFFHSHRIGNVETLDELPAPSISSHGHEAKRLGGALSIILSTPIKQSGVSLFLQLGGKTKGFVQGESLKSSPIARAGVGISW